MRVDRSSDGESVKKLIYRSTVSHVHDIPLLQSIFVGYEKGKYMYLSLGGLLAPVFRLFTSYFS